MYTVAVLEVEVIIKLIITFASQYTLVFFIINPNKFKEQTETTKTE